MLLIAVLEVRWSRWGLDGGAVTLTAEAAAPSRSLEPLVSKLFDSVSSSFKWLEVVRVAVRISWLSKSSCHLPCAV